jgi:hypothetical protein
MSEARARLDNLPTAYPLLFPDGSLPWGFELGDGWSGLIETLCARIDTILREAPGASIDVRQAKEKFGGLRFYYTLQGVSEPTERAVREAVDLAQMASAHICELCGRPGSLGILDGWLTTQCLACRAL